MFSYSLYQDNNYKMLFWWVNVCSLCYVPHDSRWSGLHVKVIFFLNLQHISKYKCSSKII